MTDPSDPRPDSSADRPEPSAHRDNAREDAMNAAQGTEKNPTGKPGTEKPGAEKTKAKRDYTAPALGFTEMLRWAWTQLTSMRTALMLPRSSG